MSQEKPHLEIVGEETPAPVAEEAPVALPPRRRGSRWAAVIGAIVLVAALIAVAVQTRRVDQLSSRVDRLTAELATSEARIVAHERHLVQVNDSVAVLRASLADLDEVLAQPLPPRSPR